MNLPAVFSGFFCCLATAAWAVEPLARDATVYAQPDPTAPVLKILPAGTTPEPATAPSLAVPEGWQAVQVPGPHELFVENKNVDKEIEVKPGSPFYLQPDHSAPVVTTMEPGDKAELAGLRGAWTLYKLEKSITGYVKLALPAPSGPASASTPLSAPSTVDDAGRSSLPRFYEGRFAPTRNFLTYKHPYNFQLLDPNGERFAYLNISRLLLTDTIDRYFNRLVIVFGTAHPLESEGKKGVVIEVEGLHLK